MFLYEIKKLLEEAHGKLSNAVIDPSAAHARSILIAIQYRVNQEIWRIEQEENRRDAIPVNKPEYDPAKETEA